MFLTTPEASEDLLDVDRCGARSVTGPSKLTHALDGGAASQTVDEDGRVQEDEQGLTNPSAIGPSLPPHPGSCVWVPFMTAVVDRTHRGLERRPPLLLLEGPSHGSSDEPRASALSSRPVHFGDEVGVEIYVYSHVLMITHSGREQHGTRATRLDREGVRHRRRSR